MVPIPEPKVYRTIRLHRWSPRIYVRMGFNQAQFERALAGSVQDVKGICIQVRKVFNRVADFNRLTALQWVKLEDIDGLNRDTGESPTHNHLTGRPIERPVPAQDTPEEIEQIMLELAEETDVAQRALVPSVENPCGCVP